MFIISKEVLLNNLLKVVGPTLSKHKIPILTSVLLRITKEKVSFTATDLDITITSLQEVKITEMGEIAIPMKRFISIIRELPPGNIEIKKEKNNLLIKCEKIEFKINILNPEEFPQPQNGKGVPLIKINPSDLEEMIKQTCFCVGYEDVNYVLSGILFEIVENKIRLVSTDGKRLAFIEKTLPHSQPEIKKKISFILPIRAAVELQKLAKEEDQMYLYVENNKIGADFKNTQFTARPIEGDFPSYSQYIPKDTANKLKINRKKLLFSLKRAGVLSTQDYQGVKLELKKDTLIISKNTPELGEVKEVIEVQYNGAHLVIGFNPNYIVDVLKTLEDEEVSIDFFGADKPAVLKKEGYIYLLLPLKI